MIEPVGGILLGWGVSKAADFLYEQASGAVQTRLKQSELQGAIAHLYYSISGDGQVSQKLITAST